MVVLMENVRIQRDVMWPWTPPPRLHGERRFWEETEGIGVSTTPLATLPPLFYRRRRISSEGSLETYRCKAAPGCQ